MNAYRYVGVAARNRQNKPRPCSLLRPVVTGRVLTTTLSDGFRFTFERFFTEADIRCRWPNVP